MADVVKRNKLSIDMYNFLKGKLSKEEDIMKKPFNEKMKIVYNILNGFDKQLQTKMCEIYFKNNFKELGHLEMVEDMGNPFCDSSYDAILSNDTRSQSFQSLLGFERIKINWKRSEPTALHGAVSIPEYQLKKYFEQKVCVVFIIKNNSDPSYYTKERKERMYFENGKYTSEGYQFYFIHYKDLNHGRTSGGCIYYKLKDNPRLINLGVEYEKNKTV